VIELEMATIKDTITFDDLGVNPALSWQMY